MENNRPLASLTPVCPSVRVPQLILLKEFHVIYALAHVCGQDRTLLASILLRIFRHEKTEAPLLRTLNDREINMEGIEMNINIFYCSSDIMLF